MNNVNWKSFWGLYPKAVIVIKVLLLVVILDLAVSILLSFVLSDAFYLNRYMTDKRYVEGVGYEEEIDAFYTGPHYIKPDSEAGWSNGLNISKNGWHTDSLGSKISPKQAELNSRSELMDDHDDLIFLLGSSVINGIGLDFENRPVGVLRKYGYKVFDFSTIRYSIDQSFALYDSFLYQYKPKVLIVGVHTDPEVISNMFLPLREHHLINEPLLKPGYYLLNNTLVKVAPPFDHHRRKALSQLLPFLKKHDTDFYKFQYYKRLGLLPFSDLLRRIILRVEKDLYSVEAYTRAVELQKALMKKLTREAKKNGTKVIFIKLDYLNDLERPFYKRMLYQFFYQDKSTLHTQILKDSSMNILDATNIFKETGRPFSELYLKGDTEHFTSEGWVILADRINQEIIRKDSASGTEIVKIHD